jgi:hypothetical protein
MASTVRCWPKAPGRNPVGGMVLSTLSCRPRSAASALKAYCRAARRAGGREKPDCYAVDGFSVRRGSQLFGYLMANGLRLYETFGCSPVHTALNAGVERLRPSVA